MSARGSLNAATASRQAEAWLAIVAMLPVTVLWAWLVVVFALMFFPDMAVQLRHGGPAAVESPSWLFGALLLGGGVGVVALFRVLVPVAFGAESKYRLSRGQFLGVVAGACAAGWVFVGLMR